MDDNLRTVCSKILLHELVHVLDIWQCKPSSSCFACVARNSLTVAVNTGSKEIYDWRNCAERWVLNHHKKYNPESLALWASGKLALFGIYSPHTAVVPTPDFPKSRPASSQLILSSTQLLRSSPSTLTTT
jgi:hypothetical protein